MIEALQIFGICGACAIALASVFIAVGSVGVWLDAHNS